MKIRPAGAELLHADRQTDMTKLINAFRNFSNAPRRSAYPSGIDGSLVTSSKLSSY